MDDFTDPDKRSSPPWGWAAMVAFALLVITAGAIVGMVTTDEEPGAGAAVSGSVASDTGTAPDAPSSLTPPTVSIPALTEPPTDTGSFEPIPPITTPTVPTDTSGSIAVGTWPAGQNGYTVILISVPESQGRTAADAAAQQASASGLPAVGVLRSSDFSSLRPGFWVTYAGVYATRTEAQAGLPQAQAAGFTSAYTRRVSS